MYYNGEKLRKRVSNDVVLPVKLMNWQIPDESVIETDIADNSNNDAISTDYLNGERSLETG